VKNKIQDQVFRQKFTDINKINTLYTGSLELDIALNGGICKGKVTLIVGGPGTGKTILSLNIAANAIREGIKVVYLDAENALSEDLIKSLFPGKMGDAIERSLGPTFEDNSNEAFRGLDEDRLVIFDSLVAAAPTLQEQNGMNNPQVALTARAAGVFFRLLNTLMIRKTIKGKLPTIVITNQLREAMDGYKGYALPGGVSQEYSATHKIFLVTGTGEKWFIEPSADHFEDKQKIRKVLRKVDFKIEKNRTTINKRIGSFWIVTKSFPGCNVGQLYNYSQIKRWISSGIVDPKWFPNCKKIEDICSMTLDYQSYKELVQILLTHNVGDMLYDET
jgi:RecA/RadA recombinase